MLWCYATVHTNTVLRIIYYRISISLVYIDVYIVESLIQYTVVYVTKNHVWLWVFNLRAVFSAYPRVTGTVQYTNCLCIRSSVLKNSREN